MYVLSDFDEELYFNYIDVYLSLYNSYIPKTVNTSLFTLMDISTTTVATKQKYYWS